MKVLVKNLQNKVTEKFSKKITKFSLKGVFFDKNLRNVKKMNF